jgi:hypothetical protein
MIINKMITTNKIMMANKTMINNKIMIINKIMITNIIMMINWTMIIKNLYENALKSIINKFKIFRKNGKSLDKNI